MPLAAGLAVLYLGLYALSLWADIFPLLITGVLNHVPAALAAGFAIPVLRMTAGRERCAWLAVLVVLFSWDAAEWVFSYYYLAQDDWAPFPGLADVFYFLGYGALFVAIGLFRHEGWALRDKRAAVDASIVAIVVGAVLWQFVILPNVYEIAGAEIVLVAYPMMDFAAFVLLLLTFASGTVAPRPSVLLLAASVGTVVATDSLNITLYSSDYFDGRYLDLGWLAGFWLMGMAFLARSGEPGPRPASGDRAGTASTALVLAPYAATAPLLAVTAVRAAGGSTDPGLIAGCLAAGLLVMLRQWLTLSENRRIYAELQLKSVELERHAEELEMLRAEAVVLAEHDGLTGVLNRRAWFARSEAAPPSAVALFDIDFFKRINDTLGHPMGDEVLREVSRRLAEHFGTAGIVGRVGGEEFAVALNFGGAAARALCESAVAAISAVPVSAGPDGALQVTVSCGVTDFGESLAAAYEGADAALYEAKRQGRARLVVGAAKAA